VFVKAHGAAATSLKGYDLIENKIGVSRNFMEHYQKPNVVGEANRNPKSLLKMASTAGINGVATNAIHSVYNHFNNLGNMNESQVIKLSETELLSLIKEEIAKLRKN
jgi:hypothetical protein